MSLIGNCTLCQFIRGISCIILIGACSACIERTAEDLTFTRPYAGVIGTEYRVVAEVDAYGIYKNMERKVVSYITLIPGVGIAGPEVAFQRRIAKGQVIRVLSAWKERNLLHSDVYYVVAFEDATLPRDIQVRVDLSRGNEGVDAGLNPQVYERLAK